MPARAASAEWKGSLKEGKGVMKMASGAYEGPYSFASRFESGTGTNPEELIAAAHSGCFSMALSGALGRAEVRSPAAAGIRSPANGGRQPPGQAALMQRRNHQWADAHRSPVST